MKERGEDMEEESVEVVTERWGILRLLVVCPQDWSSRFYWLAFILHLHVRQHWRPPPSNLMTFMVATHSPTLQTRSCRCAEWHWEALNQPLTTPHSNKVCFTVCLCLCGGKLEALWIRVSDLVHECAAITIQPPNSSNSPRRTSLRPLMRFSRSSTLLVHARAHRPQNTPTHRTPSHLHKQTLPGLHRRFTLF